MAEDKKTEKVVLEREYNVPLRKAFIKVPRYKKSNKAVLGLKEFIKKHMKATDLKSVKISKKINEKIWENGIKNPPHHIKVKALKYETYVAVELAGEKPAAPKKEDKKPTAKKKVEAKPEAKTEDKKEVKDATTEKKKTAKPEVKEEKTEEKKAEESEKKTEEKAKAKEE